LNCYAVTLNHYQHQADRRLCNLDFVTGLYVALIQDGTVQESGEESNDREEGWRARQGRESRLEGGLQEETTWRTRHDPPDNNQQ